MFDAVVIGSGPNGLVGAITLARQGWSVLVLEAKDRPGGALYSVENTRPGFVHDVGAAFFPFAKASPAFRELQLDEVGLRFVAGKYESAHPAPDGTCASISRDIALSRASFGEDGDAWAKFHDWANAMGDRLPEALLAPLVDVRTAFRLGVKNIIGMGLAAMGSASGYARWNFRTEAARRVIPALSLHVDLGPADFTGGALGLVLGLLAAKDGFLIPVGGAKAITDALLKRFSQAGGKVQYESHVDEIVVRDKRAVAVRTSNGDEIPFRHAVLADVGPPSLFFRLLDEKLAPYWLRKSIGRFRYGWGTFKMDWALSGPVPWTSPEACEAAVVHTGDSLQDLQHFTQEVRSGQLPSNPYLVIGQQSLLDSTRAPEGQHTLWAYSRVPNTMPGGWEGHKELLADRIDQRIEQLAPGFRERILARAIHAPADLEAMDENLVDGDLGGGSAQIDQQLFLRPTFPYFRYRTHVRGVYLASASAHPGAGVHGACGRNAAMMALADAKK
ncbi:MAG: phytoene desaturase family protein [Gemmataceae bacterium]